MNPLDYAMQIELQGKEYYLEQASLMEDSALREILQGLAADEERHYQFVKQIKESGLYDYQERIMDYDVTEIFEGAVKDPNYITVYQRAVEFENRAVELYRELARDAISDGEREAFQMLVREEEAHREVLQKVLDTLQRPEEYYSNL
ncbi:MAG: ferritin family protein [Firmicutes bacterium]|nr:ferritin family protein [Bacillota bacterium]